MAAKCIVLSGATVPFKSLVEAIDGPLTDKLRSLGYSEVLVQYGHAESSFRPQPGVEGFAFKPNISEIVHECDLVLTHAGSGSLLDSLERGFGQSKRKIIVVINSALMDNHQKELAYKLRDLGCVLVAEKPEELNESLDICHNRHFNEFEPPKPLGPILQEVLTKP